jgi:ABC-2 type transport system ATP-binding protein
LAGGRIEIIAEGVTREFADSVKLKDATVSLHEQRLIVDMPDSEDPNSLLDGIRNGKGRVVSIIPRRKRLEDLFVETVRDKANLNGGTN